MIVHAVYSNTLTMIYQVNNMAKKDGSLTEGFAQVR